MSGIFPFLDTADLQEEVLPMAKEWAWSFTKDDFLLKNGKPYVIQGDEAVKVWIYKALRTTRFRHVVYSFNWGNDLESLIGDSYSKAAKETLVRDLIVEALEPIRHIDTIKSVEASLNGDVLTVDVEVITVYGAVNIDGLEV